MKKQNNLTFIIPQHSVKSVEFLFDFLTLEIKQLAPF